MILQDKVALVTGSARRVGKAIALALAHEGVHQLIHYGGTSEGEARQTTEEVTALGVEVLSVRADLRDPTQIESLFAALQERFGRLDILVNSAASFQKQPFDAVTTEDWDRVMAVNLRAPFLCSQHAARLMRQSQRDQPALIVNIVDLAGVYPWQGYVQHGVSKAGLLHLTRISARELAPDVRVNAIAPGPILPPPGMDVSSPAWQEMGQGVPLQRPGHPEQIGQTVVFLAANDYITGALVNMDGGEHLLGPSGH